MQTNKFIEELRSIGLKVEREGNSIYISACVPDVCIGCVEVNTAYSVNTSYLGWNALHHDKQKRAMDIICEYAKTPVKEREVKKAAVTFDGYWSTTDIHEFFKYASTLNESLRSVDGKLDGMKIKETNKSFSYQIIKSEEVSE